ncbi:hypothetical protein [Streptomonospora wellingtoniae]|uniref:Uncharacterized protein n=1 Tax=Streptomonospora wellingtoniae TaxID=3075544 RepID=A0ABU2KV82_9ACTN|nr:hypothetical protein [Streptomonospora sp. DSM 45055]MDT0302963.1 hypothetical protein [Streptomonospora sp. DSM 45055]
MSIVHDLGPLGATKATKLVTTPGDCYVDDENGDHGYPIIVIRDRRGDVLQVNELGDADPADQREVAMAMSAAWEKVAERYAELEVRAGGGR